jgi:hypothetical protein
VPDHEPILFHRSLVADESYPRRAANAFMLFQFRRPLVWVQLALPLVLISLLGTVLENSSLSVPFAIVFDVLFVGANVISWLVRRRRLTNQFYASTPLGATREVTMTESSIGLRAGDAVSRVPYRQYERADTFGDFVFLRVRGSSARAVFSRELFTDESLAYFRSKTMGASPVTHPEAV